MAFKCLLTGKTPFDNQMCNCCSLFLSTCIPTASHDGLALGSECGDYLCEGCLESCFLSAETNM